MEEKKLIYRINLEVLMLAQYDIYTCTLFFFKFAIETQDFLPKELQLAY